MSLPVDPPRDADPPVDEGIDRPLWPATLLPDLPAPPWLRAFDRVLDALVKAGQAVAVMGFLLLLVIVTLGVFCRYALHSPLTWADNLAIWGMIWMVFTGAPAPLALSMHYTVEACVVKAPLPLQHALAVLTLVLMLVFCLLVTRYGLWLAEQNMRQIDPGLGLPYAIPYAAIPIGFLLMSLVLARRLLEHLRLWRRPVP